MAARLGVTLLAALLLLAVPANAQQYQRLHVRSFTLSSDTARPDLEQPFHVTLTVRVGENVPRLQNVYLPTFFGAEELGDEEQIQSGPGGTVYRETLTLVAHARGMLSITPAYLDAIDARDGKPKRFISNSLSIPVGGGPVSAVWGVLRAILFAAIDVVLLLAALFVIVAIFWRRKRSVVAAPSPAPQPEPAAPVEPEPGRELADAFDALRSRRDRAAVLDLRAKLWNAAGAASGETLSDVLRRPAASDPHLHRLLIQVERAAFIDDAHLAEAIDDVISEKEWTYV